VTRRSPLLRLVVEGESMSPSFVAGDRLLGFGWLRPRPGDAVAVIDPREPSRLMVKRCAAVDPGGALRVEGDNPAHSTDSRHFGPVPRSAYRGRVVYRYAPVSRAGRLRRA
jgi:nickel-type superoxide dismutase maturation protease